MEVPVRESEPRIRFSFNLPQVIVDQMDEIRSERYIPRSVWVTQAIINEIERVKGQEESADKKLEEDKMSDNKRNT